jgi:hypothetical protein
MSLIDEDAFGGRPLARIFLAATIAEARRVEAVLDQHDAEYCVRVEPYGRTLFGSIRQGAAFLVDATQADSCEAALVRAGLAAGIVRDRDADDGTDQSPGGATGTPPNPER